MKIEKITIGSLNPAVYNPRIRLKKTTQAYKSLRKSMETYGVVDPIIVNKDMTIIGGHQRYWIAKDMEMKTLPCVVLSINKEKEKMLNIALNNIRGEFDEFELTRLLKELNEGTIDMDITGMNSEEIKKMIEDTDMNTICEEEVRAYKKTHILISVPTDTYGDISDELETIRKKIQGKGEYEQSAN